ncbi:MAG TPA: hypothetical protein VEY50_01930, partial [Lysobacter sp.]|nr:hypothetical protein [Lysobacter sp.]
MDSVCAQCGCGDARGACAHALLAALREDDLDRAMTLGLPDAEPCPVCTPACNASLIAAREERRRALAARERFRARQARLERRAQERAAARASAPPLDAPATAPSPSLPPAAADAL